MRVTPTKASGSMWRTREQRRPSTHRFDYWHLEASMLDHPRAQMSLGPLGMLREHQNIGVSLDFIGPGSNTRQSDLFRSRWPSQSVSLVLVVPCGVLSKLYGSARAAEAWRR